MATKIDWDRVQRQSRLDKERYMGFTVKARTGISPGAPPLLFQRRQSRYAHSRVGQSLPGHVVIDSRGPNRR